MTDGFAPDDLPILSHVRRSPGDVGRLELIVRRPTTGEREALDEGTLDLALGLLGDNWFTRGSKGRPDGSADPERQLTVMNARSAAHVAGARERWALAGDQLYVDFDLSEANLPAGARFALGSAVLEVTPPPHTGCKKFVERFGPDALALVNSPAGRALRMRGLNAKVVVPGTVRVGDAVRKLADSR